MDYIKKQILCSTCGAMFVPAEKGWPSKRCPACKFLNIHEDKKSDFKIDDEEDEKLQEYLEEIFHSYKPINTILEEDVEWDDFNQKMRKYLYTILNKKQLKILQYRFGFNDDDEIFTVKATSDTLGLTTAEIKQIEASIIIKIRSRSFKKNIMDMLGY
ncbi:hypothetical protein [Aquamicrobium sp.]|uniref:hypothetical protein n=1 Tax=Aquamicrobium sp. TaxID=1872579 RepID=UPI002582E78A|nr:hypothetical protein [Aquamicrobium sp.]MCK9553107.1 hypothetical protein [Aquamicrobium sp.]